MVGVDLDGGDPVEGWLLKMSSKGRSWNERFFQLAGTELSYFQYEVDVQPKGIFHIAQDDGCEVSSLYIGQRQRGTKKEILYCFRITWKIEFTLDTDSVDEDSHEILNNNMNSGVSVVSGLGGKSVLDEYGTGHNESRQKSLDDYGSGRPNETKRKSTLDAYGSGHGVESRREPVDVVGSAHGKDSRRKGLDSYGSGREGMRRNLDGYGSSHSTEGRRSLYADVLAGSNDQGPRRSLYAESASLSSEAPTSRRGRSRDPEERKKRRFRLRSTSRESVRSSDSRQSFRRHRRTRSRDAAPIPTGISIPNKVTPSKTPTRSLSPMAFRGRQSLDAPAQAFPSEQQQLLHSEANKKKNRKKIVEGSKQALAAGASAASGVVKAGLAALGGSGNGEIVGGPIVQRGKKDRDELVLASASYEEARRWKDALDACLMSQTVEESTWGQQFVMDGGNATAASVPTRVGFGVLRNLGLEESGITEGHIGRRETRWEPCESGWANIFGAGSHGMRIFREERLPGHRTINNESRTPPLKAHIVLNATPLQSFLCLLSLSRLQEDRRVLTPNSGQRASFRMLERLNDHMDIIHVVCRPLYLWPSWTTARDFVLLRYWRHQEDGSYVLCVDSTKHESCPPLPQYTRGEMHAVYTISPKKRRKRVSTRDSSKECLLTAVVQVNPKGWVPSMAVPPFANQSYTEAFGVSTLLQMLDIRDALDQDRFIRVHQDTQSFRPPKLSDEFAALQRETDFQERSLGGDTASVDFDEDTEHYDFTFSAKESNRWSKQGIAANPPPLQEEFWAEPDANSFRVRGKTYLKDKIKINAGNSIARLIAADVVAVDEPCFHFSLHPTERMQVALQREKELLAKGLESDLPAFIFIVNITLPGPPYHHGVFYFGVDDRTSIDGTDGTPSSILCNRFFFGDSDEFRDKAFKLIPTVVEGNFLVRKAIGSTPCLMGTKIRQIYVRNDRFFELVVDNSGSPVAGGVIKIALGYARTLVVDLGFLFEGKEEETLPERLFGAVRIKRLRFEKEIRKVHTAPPVKMDETGIE